MMTSTTFVHFSPKGSTLKIGMELIRKLSFPLNEIIDLASPKITSAKITSNQLAIFAVPVYSGRVPSLAIKRIQQLTGEATPAILIAVYGNRDYDDTLLELYNTVEAQKFQPIAAATFIGEHTFSETIGKGRPDELDFKKISSFSEKIKGKLKLQTSLSSENIKGIFPYKEVSKAPIVPLVNDSCNACGICAEKCPAEAIQRENPKKTNFDNCILCGRCIQICPQKSRFLPPPFLEKVAEMLNKTAAERKEPEFFL